MVDCMSFPLSYCPDGYARLERLRLLHTTGAPDRIFAMVEVPAKALEDFSRRYETGFSDRPSPEERAGFWDCLLAERAAVSDDSIPCAYLSEMDQGLYGGSVGGQIEYMAHTENGWISSMVPPILKGWGDFGRLALDRQGEAWLYYRRMLDTLVARATGKFGLSHFILIDGMNFLFELFGATRAYLEVEENPDRVREAIDFAYRLNVEIQREFFDSVPLVEGGTCSNMAGWIPGRIVSESVDPFHMTSVAYFEKWGREPASRILQTFDGGVVHIHGNGRHQLEAVSTLPGLRAISLADDRGFPLAFSIIAKLKKRVGAVPAVVTAPIDEFRAALEAHTLPGGVIYKVKGASGPDEANRLMDQVRDYRC